MDINFLDCLTIMTLGKSKPKYTWQSLTVRILLVLNSFMKKRFTGKSKDLRSDLVSGQTSRPYTITGIHLLLISWIITSSDAILPIMPDIALAIYTMVKTAVQTVWSVPFVRLFPTREQLTPRYLESSTVGLNGKRSLPSPGCVPGDFTDYDSHPNCMCGALLLSRGAHQSSASNIVHGGGCDTAPRHRDYSDWPTCRGQLRLTMLLPLDDHHVVAILTRDQR